MKRFGLLMMLCIATLCLGAQERYVGGDLSMVPAYEQAGDQWLDENDNAISDMIAYVKNAGWNTVRVRLFVDPKQDDDPSTCQDVAYVKALGKRVKDAGLYLMLDFHYSDTWADPAQQRIPASWASLDDDALAAKLKTYTTEVLNDMKTSGAKPDLVQIGNEITYGLLWRTADGRYPQSSADYATAGYCPTWTSNYSAGETQWVRTASLLGAAAEAVRTVTPEAQIIVHTELGSMASNSDHFYRHLSSAGFDDYDIIGLSYYAFWHGKMESLTPLLAQFANSFPDKKVQIVETAWFNNYYPEDATYSISSLGGKWAANANGMCRYLRDLARTLRKSDNVNGINYWAPEECGKGYQQTVWPFNFHRGMWRSSQQQQHRIVKADDGTTAVKALTTYLLETIPDEEEGGDPQDRPTSFTDAQGVTYELYDNFTAGVQRGEAAFGQINIPDYITVGGQDYDVTSINGNAFFDNKSISSVTIGMNVRGIWGSAFNGCNALEKLHFAEDSRLTDIASWAFSSTPIDSLVIPAGVTVINEGTFNNCWALKHVTMLGDVQEIKQFAFAGWTDESTPTAGRNWSPFTDGVYLYSIEPPVISPKAFCTEDIQNAQLYVRQQNVNAPVFTELGFAEVLPIEGTEAVYRDVDGVRYLIDTDDKEAVVEGLATAGLTQDKITIQATVTMADGTSYPVLGIKPWAFHQCWNLKEVTVEDGITSIPEGCFAECTNLNMIDIQSTEPVSIATFAFCKWDETETQSGCPNLKAVLMHASFDDFHPYAFHAEDTQANTTLYVPASLVESFRTECPDFKAVLPLDAYTGIQSATASSTHHARKLLRQHRIEITKGSERYGINGIQLK